MTKLAANLVLSHVKNEGAFGSGLLSSMESEPQSQRRKNECGWPVLPELRPRPGKMKAEFLLFSLVVTGLQVYLPMNPCCLHMFVDRLLILACINPRVLWSALATMSITRGLLLQPTAPSPWRVH